MNISIKTFQSQSYKALEVPAEITVREIVDQFQLDGPYKIILAKVNNTYKSLNTQVKESDKVELLDQRNQGANIAYQNSMVLVYLKAVQNVLGEVPVAVANSLSKGLFTTIKIKGGVTEEQIKKIETKMQELIATGLPIQVETVDREKAMEILKKAGFYEKMKILEKAKDIHKVKHYNLDGYRDFFYGQMVPSTDYLGEFQLVKYRTGVILRFSSQRDPNHIPEFVEEAKLYKAFSEATLWGRLLDTEYVIQLNEAIDSGKIKDDILLSEALHQQKIVEIAKEVIENKKRIVLIAGPSSSGKTTFAKRLCIQLSANGKKPLYLGTDDYFVERSQTPKDANGEKNYEDIEAIDIELFNDNMNKLLNDMEADLPRFDFITGKKVFGERKTKIGQEQIIVIEGIHGLNDTLTARIEEKEKYKVYISPLTQLNIDSHNRIPTTDNRLIRRIIRDYNHRGYSASDTIKAWPKVRAGEEKNIFPYNGRADSLFNSMLVYELAVLKKFAKPILEMVGEDDEQHAEAKRLLRFLGFFEEIEDDSAIGNTSIIREFIGGSVFTN